MQLELEARVGIGRPKELRSLGIRQRILVAQLEFVLTRSQFELTPPPRLLTVPLTVVPGTILSNSPPQCGQPATGMGVRSTVELPRLLAMTQCANHPCPRRPIVPPGASSAALSSLLSGKSGAAIDRSGGVASHPKLDRTIDSFVFRCFWRCFACLAA